MRALVTRVTLVVALLLSLPATADDTDAARAHYARGTKLYDLGRYLEAAKEYESTYELKDDPALLYNIGQAYRLGSNFPDSIRAYKSFLRRVPNSSQRPQVEAHIAEMQQQLAQQPPPATTPPVTTAPPTTTAPTTTAPTTTAPTATSEAPRDRTPVYKKWWLWTIVGGVVVAGVVVGVTVGVLASRDSFNPSLGKVGPSALTVSF